MKIINDTEIFNPNECYFAADFNEDDLVTILITDKETWDNKHCISDMIGSHSFDENVIPKDIYNVMEGTWESELTLDEVNELLENAGFIFNQDMKKEVLNYC